MTANGTNTFLSHQRKICSTCRWRGYGDPSYLRLSGNNDLQGKGIGINFNLQVEGVGNPLHLQVQTPYQTCSCESVEPPTCREDGLFSPCHLRVISHIFLMINISMLFGTCET